MGHHSGGRYDGARGDLRTRREEADKKATKTAMKLAESAARKKVRELAETHSEAAVLTLVDVMHNDKFGSARALASREILKLAEAYAPKEGHAQAAGGNVFRLVIKNYGGDLPEIREVEGLPNQKQLAPPPPAEDVEFSVAEPKLESA